MDRRLYRTQVRRRKTLEAFSLPATPDETDLDALSDDLVGLVRRTLQPEHVSLWLRPDAEPEAKSAANEQFGKK